MTLLFPHFFLFKDLFIFERGRGERERASVSRGRSRGTGRRRESQADSPLIMEPNAGLNPRTPRS